MKTIIFLLFFSKNTLETIIFYGKFDVHMKLYKDSSYKNQIKNNDTIFVPDLIYARVENSNNHVVQVKIFFFTSSPCKDTFFVKFFLYVNIISIIFIHPFHKNVF